MIGALMAFGCYITYLYIDIYITRSLSNYLYCRLWLLIFRFVLCTTAAINLALGKIKNDYFKRLYIIFDWCYLNLSYHFHQHRLSEIRRRRSTCLGTRRWRKGISSYKLLIKRFKPLFPLFPLKSRDMPSILYLLLTNGVCALWLSFH